jgi:hypothetical protein
MERARFVTRSNSHKFLLRDDVWDAPGVCDVTPELTAAACGVNYHVDGVEIRAVQVEVIEGRQRDQSCRHIAVTCRY